MNSLPNSQLTEEDLSKRVSTECCLNEHGIDIRKTLQRKRNHGQDTVRRDPFEERLNDSSIPLDFLGKNSILAELKNSIIELVMGTNMEDSFFTIPKITRLCFSMDRLSNRTVISPVHETNDKDFSKK